MRAATVALVGRSNVGKSTLLNRIVGGPVAVVDDRPGVTRDRHFAPTDWAGHRFWLVDTGGWTGSLDDAVSAGISQQVRLAVEQADVVVLVVDTQEGLHPLDEEVADLLRPVQDRVVVAANKADELATDTSHYVFHALGLGTPTPLSAATGRGIGDLLDRVISHLPQETAEQATDEIRVAVVGRPNVGKSSLVNRLVGADRAIVTAEPGTTRDALDSPLRYHGRILNFIDTAGLRRRPKVKDDIEFYSALRTQRVIDRADVSVLVVDAMRGMEAQDLRIAHAAWEAGTGLIVAVNKWDLIEDKDAAAAERGRSAVAERAPFLRHVPFVFVSALTGQRVRRLLDMIPVVEEARQRRVGTAEVNRVVRELARKNQPPQWRGREVKLLYASQVGTSPPTFVVVTNRPEAIEDSYKRYLTHGLYEAWDFQGTPIRLRLRRKRGRP